MFVGLRKKLRFVEVFNAVCSITGLMETIFYSLSVLAVEQLFLHLQVVAQRLEIFLTSVFVTKKINGKNHYMLKNFFFETTLSAQPLCC